MISFPSQKIDIVYKLSRTNGGVEKENREMGTKIKKEIFLEMVCSHLTYFVIHI